MPSPVFQPGVHLPPPPSVVPLFLEVLGLSHGSNDPFTSVPPIGDLRSLLSSVQECVSAAKTRSRNAREGVRLGHDLLAGGRKRGDGGLSHGVVSARSESVRVKEEPDERRPAPPFASSNAVDDKKGGRGRGKGNSIRATHSPSAKAERDVSESPSDYPESVYGTSTGPPSKRKKLGHAPSDGSGNHHTPPEIGSLAIQNQVAPGAESAPIKLKNGTRKTQESDDQHSVLLARLASTIDFSLPAHFQTQTSAQPVTLPSPWSTGPVPVASPVAPSSLIPIRQPIPEAPKPGPKRQKDVNSDYSTPKPGAGSTTWATFWGQVEPYLKEIGEDDLAMLRFRSDDPYLYHFPRLGKHYHDVWEIEDTHLPFLDEVSSNQPKGAERQVPANNSAIGVKRWDRFVAAREFTDNDLCDNDLGLGGLTERVIGAMVNGRPGIASTLSEQFEEETSSSSREPPGQDARHALSVKKGPAGGPMETKITADGIGNRLDDELEMGWPISPHRRPGADEARNHLPLASQISLKDLETGMQRELALLGILTPDSEVDWQSREDDEVSSAMRQCQRLVKAQVAVNNARKDRLAGIVRDRLAYAEYKRSLDGLEKVIEAAWLKRSARKGRKGRKRDAANGNTHVPLDEVTQKALTTRQKWIDTVGRALSSPDVQGRYSGLPEKSVFDGIDLQGKSLVAEERVPSVNGA